MRSTLSIITFILIMQCCNAASATGNTLLMVKEHQKTATPYSQDTFPVFQEKGIVQKKSVLPKKKIVQRKNIVLSPSLVTGKSQLKNRYNRFENPLYNFFNDSIVGSISPNFVSRSRVFGFSGQRYLTEEGFDSLEEELTTMIEEGLRKHLLPYCINFAKRPGMSLTGREIFVLWLTLQPQGASEEVMVTNNPFRIPPLSLQHESYREPFALNRENSRILQLENLYIGLMALEKFLQEQDQDLWPTERLIGTILSREEHEVYLENLKFFTRKMRVPERPEIKLLAVEGSGGGKGIIAY